MARGRHWLILIPGQGAKLFVYVMLRGQSLHPGGDNEVQVPGAFLGIVKAAAWEPGAPRLDRPVRCSPPRGEPMSFWFRGSLASAGTQGTGWDLVEQKHSLPAEQWAVCWLLPSRYRHCLFSKTEPHPSSSRDRPRAFLAVPAPAAMCRGFYCSLFIPYLLLGHLLGSQSHSWAEQLRGLS